MRKKIYIISFILLIFQSCEPKKEVEKTTIENDVYETAFDISLDKFAVIINIDSIQFLDKKEQNKEIKSQIEAINKDFDIDKDVYSISTQILNDNNCNYEILKNFNTHILPKEIITKENIKQINFESLKKNISLDDVLIIDVKPGIDYNSDNKKEYVAKTYLYINIIDLKNKTLKYSETIGGTKFIEENIHNINTAYLQKMIKESLNETFILLDKKN